MGSENVQPHDSAWKALGGPFLQYEVEQFYYREAALLDARDFDTWLDLLHEDLEYWMPVRSTRRRNDLEAEFTKPGEAAFFDETKPLLTARVRKLQTDFAWAEDPPSRTRHCVSNVRILKTGAETIQTSRNFVIYRTRLTYDHDQWNGRIEDELVRTESGWTVRGRAIYSDHVGLDVKNLSIFF